MDEKAKNFYNTKKRNVDGQSCYALAAHRIAFLHPDIAHYLLYAEINSDDHPFSCAFREFILAEDCAGIDHVVDILLQSNGPQMHAHDGGKLF